MIRLLLLTLPWSLTCAESQIQGPPLWAIQGIAWTETRSYWDSDGRFHYTDKRLGSAGERGPFQCRYSAFCVVRRSSERFADLSGHPDFACEIATRYLTYLFRKTGSWERAVKAYNAGLDAASDLSTNRYLQAVKLAGLQRIYSQGEVDAR